MSADTFVLEDVTRKFGAITAVENFSLKIGQNEFVALVGPSGCGKTTLLNLLSGNDAPTSGRITKTGSTRMVHQQDGLFPWLTVVENIRLGVESLSAPKREPRVREMLGMVRLEEFTNHYPHQLSGGMRQRVELARALAGETEVLLMDEPFSALDYLTRLRMRAELAEILAKQPRTVALVTHDIEEAAQLADRIVVLSERPARICCELNIDLQRPRPLTHPVVVNAIHTVLATMGLEEV